MTSKPGEITQLRNAWNQGDQGARDELMPLIYNERLTRGRQTRVERRQNLVEARTQPLIIC